MEKDTFKIENKMLWVSGGVLLLVGIGTVIYLRRKKKKVLISKRGASTSSGFCKYGDGYPLKYGSCGNNVTALQKQLKSLGADLGHTGTKKDGIDGRYGNKTQVAVKKHLGKITASLAGIQQLTKR